MTQIAIIGAGPAGLFAAEHLAAAGMAVTVYDHKPTPGRKFLMAGRGGLNLTHSEPLPDFLHRYGDAAPALMEAINSFPPAALRKWCEDLGEPTFVGSSGRIFPRSMKASPLLRAWRARLDRLGVRFVFNHSWTGWDEIGALKFSDGMIIHPAATLLALGGASWPRLGSDGHWVDILQPRGVPIAPLRPANCGFLVNWPSGFADRHAGQPVKPVTLRFDNHEVKGEIMLTVNGVEGGAIYALSAALRDAIERDGQATLHIDLRPGVTVDVLAAKLAQSRGRQSMSTWLRKAGGLEGTAYGLFRAATSVIDPSPQNLAAMIKNMPLVLTAPANIDRAISTAGGIRFTALNENFMLTALPGVFAAGEMLDWEAPTGGYLLQACFSTGLAAANGVLGWLKEDDTYGRG